MANKLKVIASLKIDESAKRIATDLMVISAKLAKQELPSFVGFLDREKTKTNIEGTLSQIKDLKVEVGVNASSVQQAVQNATDAAGDGNKKTKTGKKVAEKIFDVEELKSQGRLFFKESDNIVRDIQEHFKSITYTNKDGGLSNVYKDINVDVLRNSENKIVSITVALKNYKGILEDIHLTRKKMKDGEDEFTGFLTSSSMKSNRNEGKELQNRLNLIQQYETALGKIKYSATDEKSKKVLLDPAHLQEVNSKIGEAETMLQSWKDKTTAVTEEEKRQYKALKAEIEKLITKYRDLETVGKSTNNTNGGLASTLNYLNRMERQISTINSKTLHQANPLIEGTKYFKTYKDEYDKVIAKVNEHKNANKAMTDEQKRELNSMITTLQNVAKEQQRAANPPMISSRDVTNSKIIATAELDKLEAKWKRQSFLTDDFRKKVANLRTDLERVGGTGDWQKYQAQLQAVKSEYQKLKAEFKNTNDLTKLNQQTSILYNRITTYMRNNSKATKLYGDQLNALREKTRTVTDASQYQEINREFQQLTTNIAAAGKAGHTLGTTIQNIVQRFSAYFGVTATITKIINLMKTMISDVGELDKSMVSLKRVTNETNETYDAFFKQATASAKKLSSSINDIVAATADFAKLGYNITDASKLAEIAKMYSNVADMDISEATNNLVSVMKAYNIGADDAIQIVDKFDKLNNSMAITASSLGEGSKRAAAVLASAGNSLDQTLAMISGASEITQDVDKTSNAFRTLALRIQGMKGKLEELGEESEGLESISKIQTQILNITKGQVNIFDEATGKFRATYDIMEDISRVWNDLADTDRANLLEIIAGKNRANDVRALITAFQSGQVQKALQASMESAGTAIEEQERWMDSIEAKKNRIAANFEELGDIVFSSEMQKNVLDGVDAITSKIVDLVDTLGTIPTIITAIGTAVSASKLFGNNNSMILGATAPVKAQITSLAEAERNMLAYNSASEATRQSLARFNTTLSSSQPTWRMYLSTLNGAEATTEGYLAYLSRQATGFAGVTRAIKQYNIASAQGSAAQTTMITAIRQSNPQLAQYLINLNGANASVVGYAASAAKATVAQKALNLALNIGSAVKSMGISLVITAITMGLTKFIGLAKEARETVKKLTEEMNVQTESFKNLKAEYQQIINSYEDEATKNEKLAAFKEKLIKDYEIEARKIEELNAKRKDMLDLLDEEESGKRTKYLEDTQKEYEKILKKIENGSQQEYKLDFGIKGGADVSDKIQALFDGYRTFSETTGFLTSTSGILSLDVKDNIEYLERLKEISQELYRMGEKEPLTGTDKAAYKSIQAEIKRLEKKMTEDDLTVFETYNAQKAKEIYDIFTEENGQFEDVWNTAGFESWMTNLQELIDKQPGAVYLKDAMDALLESMKKTKEEEPGSKELSNIEEAAVYLENAGSAIKKLSKEIEDGSAEKKIKDIADAFDRLDSIISNNKDPEKYLSAKELIEIIDQYPELAENVLQTAYGYKIEQDALENLKKAKLEEEKIALETQLREAEDLVTQTENKLKMYESEIGAIKSVADAKLKLAELDSKLAMLNSRGTSGMSGLVNKARKENVEQQMTDLQSYIDSSTMIEEYKKNLKALRVEIDVLGTGFDDIKDTTKDTNNELDSMKDKVKELQDEMKDGQKDINDLVKLTIEMIKHQKNEEKQMLKDRITAYKESVAQAKKLLDTEKSIHDFQDDLKEKNKTVTNIKSELDALSVEGIEYSLADQKRKLELQKKYEDAVKERNDFLYEHEIDQRKENLDNEASLFENNLEIQIKDIENYLERSGDLRRDAIALINGATKEFYNDLFDYTQTYTDMSSYEFNKLWNNAYAALRKYGNGVIDVEYTLAYLDGMLVGLENRLKQIESAANAAKNSTSTMLDDAIKKTKLYSDGLDEAANKMRAIYSAPIGPGMPNSPQYAQIQSALVKQNILNGKGMNASDLFKYTFHSGGVVGGEMTGDEVVAKLKKGEVVFTPKQIANLLMNKTMTNLFPNGMNDKQYAVENPTINSNVVINVTGNTDDDTINKIKRAAEEAVSSALNETVAKQNRNRTSVRY